MTPKIADLENKNFKKFYAPFSGSLKDVLVREGLHKGDGLKYIIQ